MQDTNNILTMNTTESRLNCLPPLSVCYPVSPTQRLSIHITPETQMVYLQTFIHNELANQVQVPLSSPFDLKLLFQKASYYEIPALLHNNFTARLSQGIYTLFPLLRGGGGALTCARPPQKKVIPSAGAGTEYEDSQLMTNTVSQKKQDIKMFYLPEQDGCPKPDGGVQVGPFYEELVDRVFKRIERESRDKFKLSTKKFRKYMSGEIQVEEAKMLQERFEENFKENKSLADILWAFLRLIRKDLYLNPLGKTSNADVDVMLEELHPYEEKILLRMITSTLLKKVNPYVDEAEGFEGKVATKLKKYAKHMIKKLQEEKGSAGRNIELDKRVHEIFTLDQKENKAKKASVTASKIGRYRTILSLPYNEGIKMTELIVLRGLTWSKYTASLLVKHYNAITESTDPIDKRNKVLIEEIVSNMLASYQEKEDGLTAEEMGELVGLGGIKHQPKDSKEMSLFQRLLSQFVADINNDLVFNSLKVQALATIIYQCPEDSSRINDDLKQCMDVLHRQVERRLFTAENQNMQDCMDALNLVLYTMASKKAKGLREQKEMAGLAETFKDLLPSGTKAAFSLVFGDISDPSLQIKAKYAQEALKRIGKADSDLSDLEAAILEAAPAVISIVSGVFTFNAGSVVEGLAALAGQGLKFYVGLEKDWYDEVNKVYFLANMEFEEFEKRYFNPASKVGIRNQELAYYITRELHKIARTSRRMYTERKKAIEWLGAIYEARTAEGERLNHFSFGGKGDIKQYIHKCLSDLARMPQEESISFDSDLADTARQVLRALGLEALKQDTAFEFVPNKISDANALLVYTLKSSMTLEYALSSMYTNCRDYYEKEIKHLDYIEIEGEKYINKAKLDKREVLWSSSASHALDTFLTNEDAPVLLIQGDAGTGKSTFLKIIEYQQWKRYKQGLSEYIPIFVRLAEVVNPAKCLTETFQTLHFSHKVLEQFKEEGAKRSYLFIFDGYDELKAPKNLYEVNKLFEYGKSAKMIVTSREEYLKGYGNYMKYFRPKAGGDLLEYRITPLAKGQREFYFNRRVLLNRKIYDQTSDKALKRQLHDWLNVEKYINTIRMIPGLEDLIKTPYMLTIITNILPSLESDTRSRVTKASIYKVFTMKGFEVEMNRILENSSENLPKGIDLEKSFYEFAKDLAINLYLTDKTSITAEGSTYVMDYSKSQLQKQEVVPEQSKSDEANRFARFFSDDPKVKLARSGVPITMMDGQVRFNHKSIMEYFAARCLYDELKFCPADALHKRSLSWKLLKEESQIGQESDVLNFLKEMIGDNDFKQTDLKDKVELEINSGPPSAGLSSSEKDTQTGSPMKASGKLGSPLKSGATRHTPSKKQAERLLYLHHAKPPANEELKSDKEDQKGVHVIEKLREALRLRAKGEVTNTFYVNLIMITSSYPDMIEHLELDDLKSLEQLNNVPKELKERILLALAKYFHNRDKLSEEYALQHLNYKLKGKYSGEKIKEPKGWAFFANGLGVINYDNGDSYNGSWAMDKKQGYGTYTFAKDDIFRIYDGHWYDDMFCGKGKAEFTDNSIYYGSWDQGLQVGMGEYMQCVTEKNGPVIVEVYRGCWNNGKKHGFGSIRLEGYNDHGYKAYHGVWENGVLVKGEMEFMNGTKVEGTYSYELGFKPSAGKLLFNKDYAVRVFEIPKFGRKTDKDKDAQLEAVGLKDVAKSNNDPDVKKELLVKDSNGNSRLLLLCREARSWVLNKVLPVILELGTSFSEFLECNNRGENLIHMLICNESVSLQFKNVFLERLRQACPDAFMSSILPTTNRLAEVPLVYATEKLRVLDILKIRRKKVDFNHLKYLLMTKLVPLESPRKYITEQMKQEDLDPLALALAEFSKRINHDQYLGIGSVGVKSILQVLRDLNDKTFASLLMQNEEKLLLKLIKNQFFYLGGKNLRLILLSKMTIAIDKKEKKTLEQLILDSYGNQFNVSLFQIEFMRDFTLPKSKITTTLKEDKESIVEECNKFLLDILQEFLEKNITGAVSRETWNRMTTTLFLKLAESTLKKQSSWEKILLWLKSHFNSLRLGEESLHEMVQILISFFGRLKETSAHSLMLVWLATPKTGFYSSIKYCYEIFANHYFKHTMYQFDSEIYRWFEEYLQAVRQAARNNKIQDFKLEELENLIASDEKELFKPLLLQSLVVTAIEMKDANLAIKLIEKHGQVIEKLHHWKTVFTDFDKLREAAFSNKILYGNKDQVKKTDEELVRMMRLTEIEDVEDCTGIVRAILGSPENEFTGLNEKYNYTFYKDQIYFADINLWNVMVLSGRRVSEPRSQVMKITQSVAIVEFPEGYYNSSYFKLDREVKSHLLECITHESMREVLEALVKKSIHVTGLRQYVMSKPQKLALDLFFQSDYLLYDEDYVHKCVIGQDAYPELQEFDYFDAIKQYVIKQYTNAFDEKISPSSVISQPSIVKINKVLLRSNPHIHKFFKSIVDSLIAKFVLNRKDCRKQMLIFLQEVISSLQGVLQSADYAQFCYDAYTNILAALRNDKQVTSYENTRSAKNLEVALSLAQSQVQALEAEISGVEISIEERDEKTKAYKEQKEAVGQMNKILEVLKHAQSAVSSIRSQDFVELRAMRSPMEVVIRTFTAVFKLLGHDIPTDNSNLSWEYCSRELADPNFLQKLTLFNRDSVTQDTISAVEKLITPADQYEVKRASNACFNLVNWVLSICQVSKLKIMIQSQNMKSGKELQNDYQAAKADFEGLGARYKNQDYRLKILSDKVKELSDKIPQLEAEIKGAAQSKTKKGFPYRSKEEANIEFKFFVDTLWKQLPGLPPRKATSLLFNWIDSWLLYNIYARVKLLTEAVCSGELVFEDITPFAMLIYEKLLACAIRTGSQELALSVLAKFKGKITRVKPWEISGKKNTPNMSESVEIAEALKVSKDDAENVKADKTSDLNSRDKRLKYFKSESKIFALVPTASDLEGKVAITHETEDVVMIVEDSSDLILKRLAEEKMTDVLVKINELGIYVGDFEGLIIKSLSAETPTRGLKGFRLLCKLSSLNYPLSKIAQAKLSSPEEWVCNDVNDYLQLLEKYPESHKDPLAWLLKSGVKNGVLKKILGVLDTKEKTKHFFNDFVYRYTKDPIKFIEEILLGNLIENHPGMIFSVYLQLIKDSPSTQNKFVQVYKKCVLEKEPKIAKEMSSYLLQFPEQCPKLDELVAETVKKCEEDYIATGEDSDDSDEELEKGKDDEKGRVKSEEGFFDCVYGQFIKQLLHEYLSGRKTASQTKLWVRRLFANRTRFVGADCSEQELVEVLVYNLLMSLTDPLHEKEIVEKFFKKEYNQKAKNLLSSVSSLFDAVLGLMAYEVTTPAEGCFTLVKSNCEEILTMPMLVKFHKELLTLAQINKIALPKASTCKGYTEFVKNTAISLPDTIDVISFFILNIQVFMHIHLIEELREGSLQLQDQTGDNSTILQFTKNDSEPLKPMEHSAKDGKKTIKISYFIDDSVTLPSPALFKTNTDNFLLIKSALFPETSVQPYDPFLASICCLHDSLSAGTDTERVISSLQQAFPYFNLPAQQNSKATLTEQLVYNSLYCLCMKAKSSEQEGSSELLKIFEKVNDTSLLDLALSALGVEVQSASGDTITIKQTGKSLCSADDMLSLKTALAELMVITTESLLKMVDNTASKCREHQYMREKLGINLPEDLSALNYCLFSITLAHRISNIFAIKTSLAGEQQIPQDQGSLKVNLVEADDKERLSSLISSSETTIVLQHKIRKIKRVRTAYMLDLDAFPAASRNNQRIHLF